jgi:hypothetical protein
MNLFGTHLVGLPQVDGFDERHRRLQGYKATNLRATGDGPRDTDDGLRATDDGLGLRATDDAPQAPSRSPQAVSRKP